MVLQELTKYSESNAPEAKASSRLKPVSASSDATSSILKCLSPKSVRMVALIVEATRSQLSSESTFTSTNRRICRSAGISLLYAFFNFSNDSLSNAKPPATFDNITYLVGTFDFNCYTEEGNLPIGYSDRASITSNCMHMTYRHREIES